MPIQQATFHKLADRYPRRARLSSAVRPYMRFLIPLAFLLASCASTPLDNRAVETVVRSYIMAYQDQRWDDLVSLMHPETIRNQRNAILAGLPKRDADITDAQRTQIDELLKTYDVSTIKDARKLAPQDLVLRMLKHSSESATMQAMKKAKTTVKDISVERTTEGIFADASVVSRLGEKEFSGATHFLLRRVKGKYLVVSMSKE